MIIRSLFARLAFIVNKKGLSDFNAGMRAAKKSMIGLAAMVAGGTVVLGAFIKEGAKLEQIKVAFRTMLGSASLAKETLDNLFQFARRTPFEIQGVLGTARILMGMGSSASQLLPQLKMVGDVASGLAVPLEQIALSFGKVQAAGYLTGYELQNLRRAGVPLVKELSKIMGKNREEVQHLVRIRKVSFQLFEQAFKNMTEAGGVFNNLMFEQSKTLLGIFVNVKDYLKEIIMFTGELLLPVTKKIAKSVLDWLKVNQKMLQQRVGKFLVTIVKILSSLLGIIWEITRSFYILAEAVGGTERILKLMLFTMSALIGLGFAQAIGLITSGIYQFLTATKVTAVLLAGLPALASLWGIAVLIVLDSLYRYLTGWKGKTLAGWFDEKFLGGKLKKKFENLKEDLLEIKDIIYGVSLIIAGLFAHDFGKGGMFREGLGILKGLKEKRQGKQFDKLMKGEIGFSDYRFQRGFSMYEPKEEKGSFFKDFFRGMYTPVEKLVKSFDYSNEMLGFASFIGDKISGGNVNNNTPITINQTLNGVTRDDAGVIADRTSQALKEIIDYHNIVF